MARPTMFEGAGRITDVIVRIPEERIIPLRTLAAYFGTDLPSFMRYLSFERLEEFERTRNDARKPGTA